MFMESPKTTLIPHFISVKKPPSIVRENYVPSLKLGNESSTGAIITEGYWGKMVYLFVFIFVVIIIMI